MHSQWSVLPPLKVRGGWSHLIQHQHHKSCDPNCIPILLRYFMARDTIDYTIPSFPVLEVNLQHVQYYLGNQDMVYNGFLQASDALTVSVQQSPLHLLLTGVSWS